MYSIVMESYMGYPTGVWFVVPDSEAYSYPFVYESGRAYISALDLAEKLNGGEA